MLLIPEMIHCVRDPHASHVLNYACHSYSGAHCRYVIKKRVRGTTSTNGDPKDQLRPTHDLEGHQSYLDGGVVQRIKGLPGAKPHNPAN